MSTLDRLREAVRLSRRDAGAQAPAAGESALHPPRAEHPSAAEQLGGDWCAAYGQPFLAVNRRYSGGHRHGRTAVLDALPPSSGVWRGLSLLAADPASAGRIARGRLLFLDLETTGLAGGAGTYAFLVGVGWFEGGGFRIQQFFLSSFTAERAILAALADMAQDAAGLVTFNGKSFDVPLIDTRYALHRLGGPFGGVPHVDMLHVARRFWRTADEPSAGVTSDAASRSCRLADLEEAVCGHVREDDVPGHEIPARYFHFVRSGDARPLEQVLEHNRLDILSLALLTARAAQLLEEGHAAAETAREAFGLGVTYERAGLVSEARSAYGRAAGLAPDGASERLPVDPRTRAEALRAYAVLCRRERRFEDAALAWRLVLEIRRCPPPIAREAAEALAVHHEHRERDLDRARQFALQSLQYRSTASRTQAVHHRLARLDRKMGQSGFEPLF